MSFIIFKNSMTCFVRFHLAQVIYKYSKFLMGGEWPGMMSSPMVAGAAAPTKRATPAVC